ncbi:MAG TPA: tRNA pseudouridine(38-40) synthase TruA [Gammaproteobacteria bacterium]|nr:tRNA pseudouridine(38-40) synthase TruA [Gammaproteobacteria bacterium]
MRIALGIEYDGTNFVGWQRQTEGRTIQGCVEQALSRVADHPVTVVCAGRTDTGVHATGQVVHFDTESRRGAQNWVRGSNANLPDGIRVQWAEQMTPLFHARFSAISRHYRYVILNRSTASALLGKRACREYARLDAASMATAGQQLVGEHDFSAFRAAACQAKSPVRTIQQLDVHRSGDFIYLDVRANAFLHHMVRCIAGVLIAVGRGERPPAWVGEVLATHDRTLSGFNAPPAGLYLVAVHYAPEFTLPAIGWLPQYG